MTGVPAPARLTGFPFPTGKRPQHTVFDDRRQRRVSKSGDVFPFLVTFSRLSYVLPKLAPGGLLYG